MLAARDIAVSPPPKAVDQSGTGAVSLLVGTARAIDPPLTASAGASPASQEVSARVWAVVFSLVGSSITFDAPAARAGLLRHLPPRIEPQLDRSVLAPRRSAPLLAVLDALREHPIESGYLHPGEAPLKALLRGAGMQEVLEVLRSGGLDAGSSAGLLRLLGRSRDTTSAARREVVRWGLASRDPEIRDAAMQAVENWGDSALVPHLRRHIEDVDWLEAYRLQIVADMVE